MPGIVFIGRLHTDFMPGIVRGQGIGLTVRLGDRLAVALPLVGHARIRHAVSIADGGGKFAADFALTRDGDGTFVIRLRLRIWCGDVSNRRCCLA